ncbi:MAG: hypothetical protein RBQ80_06490 [Methanocorpusculum sp.]|jgi:predicted ribosome quality control (RQC) complex YloA/Tae2 family protein|nr:hypothetical protein [Methanocorpusculum sp.]
MASNKDKDKKKASREASRELSKKTKSAKKALKQLKKEKKAAESLIDYCRSLSTYLTEQAAIEVSNDELLAELAEEKLLKDFYSSYECADAFAAYRSRFAEEQTARCDAAEQPVLDPVEAEYEKTEPENTGY